MAAVTVEAATSATSALAYGATERLMLILVLGMLVPIGVLALYDLSDRSR